MKHRVSPPELGSLRPLAVLSLLMTVVSSGFSSLVSIWAVTSLGASPAALGIALFLRAGSGVLTGPAGGRLSDRIGRRPVLLAGWLGQSVVVGALALVGAQPVLGLALVVLFGPMGPPAGAAAQAMVADLLAPAQREAGYAWLRSVIAIGGAAGPALAALLVVGGHWSRMFAGLGVLGAGTVVAAGLILPGTRPVRRAAGEANLTAVRVRADHAYLLLLVATGLVAVTLAAIDRVLPIAAVDDYRVTAAQWGWTAVLSAAQVVVFQTALTRRLAARSVSARLVGGALLTGWPLLLLAAAPDPWAVVLVVVVHTAGEMVWTPTAMALAATAAPDEHRGQYLGAYGGAVSISFAVGPFVGLELRSSTSTTITWTCFAAIAVLAAALAARLAGPLLRRSAAEQVAAAHPS